MYWADVKISAKYVQLNFCWHCPEANHAHKSTWHRLLALKRSKERRKTTTSCETFQKFLKLGIPLWVCVLSPTPDCGKENSHMNVIHAPALIIWEKECCVTASV